MATLLLTVAVFAAVMAVLLVSPVIFRRQIMTGSIFDPYYEQQCIEYIKQCWLMIIRQQDDYLAQRHRPDYQVSLFFLLSLVVVLSVERDRELELRDWFLKWLNYEANNLVQLKIMLVAWQTVTKNKQPFSDEVLMRLLQRWQA